MSRFVASVAAAVVLCSGEAGAQQNMRLRDDGYASRIDTTFAFDKNGSVILTAVSGDITVTGWSRGEIRVRAVSEAGNIRFNASSSRVSLEVGGFRRSSDTRFELTVPYGVRVDAETRSGDISVRGTRGPVEALAQNGDVDVEDVATRLDVRSFNGDIVARNIAGDCTINSTNGEVSLSDVRGSVDAVTVSGDIELRGIVSKLVRAKTTNGDVTFDGTIDPAGRYELSSHSGDINLRIPRDASAQLTVSTWSGAIDSQFPITLRPGEQTISSAKSKRFVFDIGGGSARITVEAFSGDINIASSGPGADR